MLLPVLHNADNKSPRLLRKTIINDISLGKNADSVWSECDRSSTNWNGADILNIK